MSEGEGVSWSPQWSPDTWESVLLFLTFSELLFAVLLGHFNHEDLVFTDVGGHPGEALPAGAAYAHQ